MKNEHAIIFTTVGIVIVIVATSIFIGITIFLLYPTMKQGYVQIDGVLQLRAYPKISEIVPTVMIYVVVPLNDSYEIYLTENGIPLSSLMYSRNDRVRIEGILSSRHSEDRCQTYWMIEIFHIWQFLPF